MLFYGFVLKIFRTHGSIRRRGVEEDYGKEEHTALGFHYPMVSTGSLVILSLPISLAIHPADHLCLLHPIVSVLFIT
jgi:hypothetical protein